MKAQKFWQTQKKYRKAQPVPGSEMIGSTKFRKSEHGNNAGGNWGEEGRRTFLFLPSPSSPISRAHIFACLSLTRAESLEQAKKSLNGTNRQN